MNTTNTSWSLVGGAVADGRVLHLQPARPTQRTVHPWGRPVPAAANVVTFTAPCPRGHVAEWIQTLQDTHTESSVWCPVCEAGVAVGGEGRPAAREGGSGGPGGVPGSPAGVGVDPGALSVTEGDAA